jgi:LacI family transcriptional regulator
VSVKKPTITDVAARAGVSIATVSRVINRTGAVEKTLRGQVETAAKELSYLPNRYAQAMKRGNSFRGKDKRIVGVILPIVSNTFFSHALEQISGSADKKGIQIVLFSCHGDTEKELSCIESAFMMGIDGLMYCPSTEKAAEKIYDYFPADFPIVIFYRRNIIKGIPHIFHDNEQGGYIATKYLLHQGRREIAFFGSIWINMGETKLDFIDMLNYEKRGAYSALDRFSGYVRALKEYNIDVREELVLPMTGFGFESGKKGAKDFLSRICSFDAVLCANDEVAAGVISVLREQNYSVPDSISIIGFDDLSFATAISPMLTTVRQDPNAIGEGALEMISALMDGEKIGDRCIKMSIVIRDSTPVKNA